MPGDTVAVLGLGPIGSMFVRMAKVLGARVIAIGRRQSQLDRAERMGADEGSLATDGVDIVPHVKSLTNGRGVDIAIEAVGQPEAWQMAVRLLRRGGTVNFFGGCPPGTNINLDTNLLHYSELTCKASFHHRPKHIRKALNLVADGQITSENFVNRVEPLSNLAEVIGHLMGHKRPLKTPLTDKN